MDRVSGKIRRLLLEGGLVSHDEWNAARQKGDSIVETLLQNHSLDEAAFMATLGQAAGLAPVDLTRASPDAAAVEALNQETCRQHAILPLTLNNKILTIAVSDPYDVLLFDDLRRLTGCQIQAVLASPVAIRQMTDRVFDRGQEQVNQLMDQVSEDAGTTVKIAKDLAEELDDRTVGTGDAPAVKLINLMMLRALKEKASDIHIEPGDKALVIRFRVDGRLYEVMKPPRGMQPAVISRLKIMAQLDIAERYAPQDGKFQIRYEGRKIDFRLSILPVVGGEKAVMRILDTGNMSLKLESLGYEEKALTDILLDCARSHPDVVTDDEKRRPAVRLNDFTKTDLMFELQFWTLRKWDVDVVKSDLRFAIRERFRKDGILGGESPAVPTTEAVVVQEKKEEE